MTAEHTPLWNTGAVPSKFVFVPDNAKPIDAGSIVRAAHIVRCVNSHDALVAALEAANETLRLIRNEAYRGIGTKPEEADAFFRLIEEYAQRRLADRAALAAARIPA